MIEMDTAFKTTLRKALNKIEALKTSSCLEVETIGFYLEGKLSKGERKKVEDHISSCLYCLHQLLELKELIYFQSQKSSLSSSFLKKIIDLYPNGKKPLKEISKNKIFYLAQGIADFITLPFRQWRYSLVSIAVALVVVFITLNFWSPEKRITPVPKLDPNSFVQIQALNNEGRVISEVNGVIIDPDGIVATNLYPLIGAKLTRIISREGKTYQIQKLWKDEENNLALLKIEGRAFSTLPLADLNQIYVGQKVLILAEQLKRKKGVNPAIISDFKNYPGRLAKGKGGVQYIQVFSLSARYTGGTLIDEEGRLIGLIVTEEKGMNLAVPLKEAFNLIKEEKPIPISDLKNISFNPEALNYYFKGILAKDAQRNDEAMEFFKKAIELNPDIEGPHLELGNIYYIKRLYDQEIKEYQEVLRINPQNTDALFYLGEAYETKGLYELGIEQYKRIITISPEDAEAYYNLGLAYLTLGKKGKALEIYPKLKVLDPGFAEKLKKLAGTN